MDFMDKGEILIPEERIGLNPKIVQTLQMGNNSIGMERQKTVKITQVPTKSEDLPSLSRLCLRRDLLGKSGDSVEKCTMLPLQNYENNETRGDLSPQQQEYEFVQCDSSFPISSLFNVASPSCLFLPEKDPLSECEEHFEAGRMLDCPEDTKEVKGLVDVVEHSVCEEAEPQLREENLKRSPCGPLTTPFFPECENIVRETQSPVKTALSNALDSCFVNEHEESVEMDRSVDPEDRKDGESLVDIDEHSVSEEAHVELGDMKLREIPSPDKGHDSVNEDEDVEADESQDDLGDFMTIEGESETVVNSVYKNQAGVFAVDGTWKAQSSGGATGHRSESIADSDERLSIRTFSSHSQAYPGQLYEYCVCQKQISRKSYLDHHMRSHSGESHYHIVGGKRVASIGITKLVPTGYKPSKCLLCQKRFSTNGHLRTHMRVHTGEKPYKCSVCQKRFSINSNLNKHMFVHTGEKPYKCSLCQKRYSSKANLTKHMRLHTGEKPYECSVCQKRFSIKYVLSRHMRMHTGDKPYQCSVCQKGFSTKNGLSKHMPVHTD